MSKLITINGAAFSCLFTVNGQIVGGGAGGGTGLSAIDTTQSGFTGLVDQWKFEDNLNAEGGTGRNLSSTSGLDRYCTIREKRFYSLGRNSLLNRGGTHDAVLSLPGAITVYLLADIHQMPTADSVIFLFGTPGSNSAGTNYQWAYVFESSGQFMTSVHEHGGGIKEISNFVIPPSSVNLWTMTRTADLGGGAQDVKMYLNGALISTDTTPTLADDGSGSQQINIGQIISMLIGDAVVCNTVHTPETIAAVAAQVGVS